MFPLAQALATWAVCIAVRTAPWVRHPYTEGYWVADAKLGYRVNRNLDFQLNVYNLFDTDYVSSINKSGYRYHPCEPRTFLLTANMHSDPSRGAKAPLSGETLMMYHIPGVLSAQDVTRFREQLDAADWVDGRATTGAQGRRLKQPAGKYAK